MKGLSFIVPMYNVEKYIARCIISLLTQNDGNDNIEIILVDDGSTDKSFEICDQYAKESNIIKVFRQKNLGANVARNLGLKNAKGEWVCFVDGDDWVDEKMYVTLLPEMLKGWDIIMYSYKRVNEKREYSGSPNAEYLEIYGDEFRKLEIANLNNTAKGKYNLSFINPTSVWNKLYRRRFLQENHLWFNPSMPKIQDLEFNLNVYKYAKQAVYIPEELYYYRFNTNSISNRYQPDIIEKFKIINSCIEKFIRSNWNQDLENAYYERIATHLRTIMVLYLCNKKNNQSYFVRRKKFYELLHMDPYQTAMKKVDLSHFPFKEKALSIMIKHHNFIGCNILYQLEEILKNLKGYI